MKILILLLCSLHWSLGNPAQSILGAEECTWGPAYWCQGLAQSAKCSATDHCIRNFWINKELDPDDDDVCTICKNMVKQARDTLLSNETQLELKEVFEGSCNLIPLKPISQECIKIVDQFIPELVETLASEMNPQLVCATAGLCNSKRIDDMLEEYYKAHPKTECEICRSQTRKIVEKLREATPDMILDKLLETCGKFGSYSDACMITVLDNFDDIYHVLTTHVNDELCDLAGICSESFVNAITTKEASSSSSSSADIQCEFCEKVVQHWKDTWTANTTEEEFKTVLEALCHKLSGNKVDRCLHIVDDYYIPWFHFLIHELEPAYVCTLFGLCNPSQNILEVDPRSSIFTLLTSEVDPGLEESRVNLIPLVPALQVSSPNTGDYFVPRVFLEERRPTCEMCQYALHRLQQQLAEVSQRTVDNVKPVVDQICSTMPQTIKGECDGLMSVYGPVIIQFFVEGYEASNICSMLSLCEEGQEFEDENEIEDLGDNKCALCEYAIHTLEGLITDRTNEQEIRHALENLCSYLPNSLSGQCKELVDQYTDQIIHLIINDYPPDEICAKIKLCPPKNIINYDSQELEEKEEEQQPVIEDGEVSVKDETCVLCQYVVKTLDEILEDKTNQEEIRNALETVCGYLPKTVTTKCVKLVDTYSEIIIELLTEGASPKELCAAMSLCPSGDLVIDEPQPQEDERPYCTLCEYAIGEVDKMLTDEKTEQEVKQALDKICYMLTAPISKECLKMVETYSDEVIHMFVNDYTPEEICTQLKLCKPHFPIVALSHHPNEIPSEDSLKTVKKNPYCVICEFAMSIIEKKLLTNRTVDMAERAVQMVCAYFPDSVAEPCEEFVDKYGDAIVRAIVSYEAEDVCSVIHACPKETMWNAEAIGGRRCPWGPSYWCQSLFHAQSCGTLKHCQEKVWNN